jgi:hypothetical protein
LHEQFHLPLLHFGRKKSARRPFFWFVIRSDHFLTAKKPPFRILPNTIDRNDRNPAAKNPLKNRFLSETFSILLGYFSVKLLSHGNETKCIGL